MPTNKAQNLRLTRPLATEPLDEATVTEYPETIVTSREGRNKPSTLGTIGTYSSHALLRNSRFYDLPVQALLALYKWYT